MLHQTSHWSGCHFQTHCFNILDFARCFCLVIFTTTWHLRRCLSSGSGLHASCTTLAVSNASGTCSGNLHLKHRKRKRNEKNHITICLGTWKQAKSNKEHKAITKGTSCSELYAKLCQAASISSGSQWRPFSCRRCLRCFCYVQRGQRGQDDNDCHSQNILHFGLYDWLIGWDLAAFLLSFTWKIRKPY